MNALDAAIARLAGRIIIAETEGDYALADALFLVFVDLTDERHAQQNVDAERQAA